MARGRGRGRGPPRDTVLQVGRRSPPSSSSSSSLSPPTERAEPAATPATGPVAVTGSMACSEEAEAATVAAEGEESDLCGVRAPAGRAGEGSEGGEEQVESKRNKSKLTASHTQLLHGKIPYEGEHFGAHVAAEVEGSQTRAAELLQPDGERGGACLGGAGSLLAM